MVAIIIVIDAATIWYFKGKLKTPFLTLTPVVSVERRAKMRAIPNQKVIGLSKIIGGGIGILSHQFFLLLMSILNFRTIAKIVTNPKTRINIKNEYSGTTTVFDQPLGPCRLQIA